jgi:hypothetical protein
LGTGIVPANAVRLGPILFAAITAVPIPPAITKGSNSVATLPLTGYRK